MPGLFVNRKATCDGWPVELNPSGMHRVEESRARQNCQKASPLWIQLCSLNVASAVVLFEKSSVFLAFEPGVCASGIFVSLLNGHP